MGLIKKWKQFKKDLVIAKANISDTHDNLLEQEKRLQKVEETLDKLSKGAIIKAKQLDEVQKSLDKIKLKVKSTSVVYNQDTSTYGVKVVYSIPEVELYYDKDNGFRVNEMLKAINDLNLISFEDMNKIGTQVKLAETRNK